MVMTECCLLDMVLSLSHWHQVCIASNVTRGNRSVSYPINRRLRCKPMIYRCCGSYGFYNIDKNNTIFTSGSWQDRLKDRFLGMTLQLKNPGLLANGDDRFELLTESMGSVDVNLHVIAKNFSKFGCEL